MTFWFKGNSINSEAHSVHSKCQSWYLLEKAFTGIIVSFSVFTHYLLLKCQKKKEGKIYMYLWQYKWPNLSLVFVIDIQKIPPECHVPWSNHLLVWRSTGTQVYCTILWHTVCKTCALACVVGLIKTAQSGFTDSHLITVISQTSDRVRICAQSYVVGIFLFRWKSSVWPLEEIKGWCYTQQDNLVLLFSSVLKLISNSIINRDLYKISS